MLKSTYLQQCAHNKHERLRVAQHLQERGISAERKRYLMAQMRYLNKERSFFQKIKSEFLIFKSDCYNL